MRMCKLVVGSLATNCYIVSNENTKEAIIIDPGAQPERIMNKIKEEQFLVKAILLTHGHIDHIQAVNALKEEYGVDIYIGEQEADLVKDTQKNLSMMFGTPYVTKPDCLVKEGDILSIAGFTIKVLFTPGHTKGGVCYYFEPEEALFSGDTIFQASVGRSDFPTGSARTLSDSIKEKIFTLPDDVQIFPGHGDSTVVSYERHYNMFV